MTFSHVYDTGNTGYSYTFVMSIVLRRNNKNVTFGLNTMLDIKKYSTLKTMKIRDVSYKRLIFSFDIIDNSMCQNIQRQIASTH